MRALAMVVLMGVVASLSASEATDKEIIRYNDAVTKAQKAYDEAVAKEKAKTIAVLVPLAKQRVRSNDLSGAAIAWQSVLSLDESNPEARKFFAANGTLDAVLAQLKQGATVDLLGNQVDDKTAVAEAPASQALSGNLITITAMAPGGFPVVPGKVKAGTAITLRYVDGMWNRGTGRKIAMHSPDDATGPMRCRLRLTTDAGRPEATLVVIPTGTTASPFTFTVDNDCDALLLCINSDSGEGQGSVRYRISVVAP